MKKIIIAMILTLFIQAEDINKLEKPIPVEDISMQIDTWAEEFKKRFHIPHFGEYKGRYFGYTTQVVSLKATDPQFVNALANAYDKAYLKAQEEYALDLFVQETTRVLREFFNNSSTDAKIIKIDDYKNPSFWTKLGILLDKALALAGKKLDKALLKMGFSEEEISKLTPKEKKIYFKDKFIKNTIKKAAGDVSGMFVIQSAWTVDKNGNAMVAIITVVSPKTKQIVKDIRLKRATLIKGKPHDLSKIIPTSPKKLSQMLGIRLAYDENGLPCIISYGISSYVKTKDFYTNQSLKEDAIDDALTNADSQIAFIINGYLNTENVKKRGEEIQKYVEREIKIDSPTLDKEIKNIIQKSYVLTKEMAHMNLQGISTYKKWSYKLKTGQEIVGAVRVWKYSTLESVNNFKKAMNNPLQKTKKIIINPNFNSSPIQNDINDF